jgi:3-oxoadipate enol-lactonase
MPYVKSGGANIFWTEAGSGPPILLIMGLSFTHEMWARLLPALTPQYRVLMFDNRGMGRSSVPPGPYSMAQMARDAVAVQNAAGVDSSHVVGASMGGMIAQELALRYPHRVMSLALGCTSSSGLFGKWPHWSFAPRGWSWANGSRQARELALRRFLYADTTPLERIEEDIHIRCQCNWSNKGFWSQFAAILAWSSFRNLPSIKVPTMLLHGDQDHLVPPENGRTIARRIPNARFELVKNAGHILTTDQPDICQQLLLSFLDNLANRKVND